MVFSLVFFLRIFEYLYFQEDSQVKWLYKPPCGHHCCDSKVVINFVSFNMKDCHVLGLNSCAFRSYGPLKSGNKWRFLESVNVIATRKHFWHARTWVRKLIQSWKFAYWLNCVCSFRIWNHNLCTCKPDWTIEEPKCYLHIDNWNLWWRLFDQQIVSFGLPFK